MWISSTTRTCARTCQEFISRELQQYNIFSAKFWWIRYQTRKATWSLWMILRGTRPPILKTFQSALVMRTGKSLSFIMRRSIRSSESRWARRWLKSCSGNEDRLMEMESMRWIRGLRRRRKIFRKGFIATPMTRSASWMSKLTTKKLNRSFKFTFKTSIPSSNIPLWSHLFVKTKAFGEITDQCIWNQQTKASQASESKHLWRNAPTTVSNSSKIEKILKTNFLNKSITTWTTSTKPEAHLLTRFSPSLRLNWTRSRSMSKEIITSRT